MNGEDQKNQPKRINTPTFTVPKETTILYASNIHINVSKFGVVLDVAQQIGQTKQHIVVSRVGMSREHAKALCEQLLRLLQKKPGEVGKTIVH